MSDVREQIKRRIDQLKKEAITLLQQMIRINTENPPGNNPELVNFLAEKLRGWGMLIDIFNPPGELLEQMGLPGPRPSILVKLKESGSPILIFNSHLDTIPAGNLSFWRYPPFSGNIIEGRIWGRGALDSKGIMTAYITAMRAIQDVAFEYSGNIILAATADEEIGGETGAGYLIRRGILKGDYCIAEGMCDYICHACNGVIHLEIVTKGKAYHAMDPSKGINAIYKMAPLIRQIEKYNQRLSHKRSIVRGLKPTCSLGTITGGTKINVVPDQCVISIDRRIIPDEELDDVRKELYQLLEKTSPKTYTAKEILVADFYKTDPKSRLIRVVNKNVKEVTGRKLLIRGRGGFTDARFFANELGIPTINFGPGRSREGNAHGSNENIRITDIIFVAKVCALAAIDLGIN